MDAIKKTQELIRKHRELRAIRYLHYMVLTKPGLYTEEQIKISKEAIIRLDKKIEEL